MADFNKLKDTIRGAIYPNGRGAISADKHQAALLDMADTMQETAAQVTELSEEITYSSPLDGVYFGNQYDDKILKDTIASAWIEVLDNTISLNKNIRVAVYRNDNTRDPQVVFQFMDDSEIVFTYSANEKLSANKHKISCIGWGSFYEKAVLHLTLDFSNHSENINFGSAESYMTLSKLSREEVESTLYLKDALEKLESQTKEQYESIHSSFEYSDALKGCIFGGQSGDNILRKSIKSMWLQIIDETLQMPSFLKFGYLINNAASGFLFQLVDDSGNIVLEQYFPTNNFLGKFQGIAGGYGDYENRVFLHYELDLSSADIRINGSDMGTQIIPSELNRKKTATLTTKEALSEVTGFNGKTIVCFGDSITSQMGVDGLRYSDYLKEITSANIINVGIGGTQYRQRVAPVLNPTSVAEGWAGLDIINMVKAAANLPFDSGSTYRNVVANSANYVERNNLGRPKSAVNTLLAIDWQNVDAVVFLAGHNDWRNGGSERGEHGSTDVNTTLGAINEIIRILLTTYPHLKLYWCTPIVQWGETSANWTEDKWSDNIKYYGYTLKELSELIKEEVAFNHIPICDLYNTLGWNIYNFSQYFVSEDGTHPRKGYKMIAQKIASFLIGNRAF